MNSSPFSEYKKLNLIYNMKIFGFRMHRNNNLVRFCLFVHDLRRNDKTDDILRLASSKRTWIKSQSHFAFPIRVKLGVMFRPAFHPDRIP